MSLTLKAKEIALDLWIEQIGIGIGEPGEIPSMEKIDEWILNRTYPSSLLENAACGDVAIIAFVREEAGLPIIS